MKKTLRQSATITGVGLHTGLPVTLTLRPAPPHTGIIFQRTDLNHFEIEATRQHVARVSYATTLMRKGVLISTVEHLLSALHALCVTDVYVELNAMEVPILDGSADPFVRMIDEAGLTEIGSSLEPLRIVKPIEIRQGSKFAAVYPGERLRITYEIDFPHPMIGKQSLDIEITFNSYRRGIAPARTFGFYHEIQDLMQNGLVRGGSFDNAIVLDHQGVMNPDPWLRYPDEFVRHKILDLIGDLSLVGRPILGHIVISRGGHALHAALTSAIHREHQPAKITPTAELRACSSPAW
ncbi:MAG: UDP-3-O-acyl-N-acetylglucosamine deacetylase [Acidobacteria bacterium]|nr:UDP-3-O-acyl-N-acetylglucosamine deacetylase [Acidobacteriota bacterium]